jgi:tetratricopeptide (TPR) repeat protein
MSGDEAERAIALVRERLASGDADAALGLAASAWHSWMDGGRFEEGRRVLTEALAQTTEATPARAQALRGAGTLAFRQGDNDAAEKLFGESLRVAREYGDDALVATGLVDLARVALRLGDFATVRERAEEARSHARAHGDQLGERSAVHLFAAASRMEGELDRARELYLESMRMAEAAGSQRGVAGERHNLGYVELAAGNVGAARAHFRASLEWVAENRDLYLLPYCLADAAVVARIDGDEERAARLLGAADALFESTGAVPDPDDRVEIDRLRSQLAAHAAAVEEGRRLGLDDAIELAR